MESIFSWMLGRNTGLKINPMKIESFCMWNDISISFSF